MTQTFVESCVDFEVAYLSTLMVRRLPYSEIPTLIGTYSSDEQIYILFSYIIPINPLIIFTGHNEAT